MKALIFAAGRGERLKPLTNHTPKPLVQVHGKPLIQYHIEALLRAGITDVVINVSWLKDQIIDFVNELCQRSEFKALNVQFSLEADYPLETGGGMLKALPLLGDEPFVVVNADIFTNFDFTHLGVLPDEQLVKLVLVENPAHNSDGDFGIVNHQLINKTEQGTHFTYAGVGLYHPKLLASPLTGDCFEEVFSIVPYIKAAIADKQAGALLHDGSWHDVGTLERLDALND